MCLCCVSSVVDIEAEKSHGTFTYVDKSCVRRSHVSKDFCTPVINEVCSGSQEGKFADRIRVEKLQLLLVVTVDWNYYGYCKGQPSLLQRLTPR